MATREALWGYRNRFGDAFGRTYFRRFGPGVVSSVGIGTYLGDPTPAVDETSRESIELALRSGVNHVDTAANYRCGRAERVVGEALRDAPLDRESVVVATKGGFLPFDGERPSDPSAYVRERFVEPGIVDPDDLANGAHAMTPDFLEWSLDRSLDRLGLDAVDCFYVHNPETQLAVRSRGDVYDALEVAFEALERRRAAGDVGAYGVATWDAFRVAEDGDRYLSLAEVLSRAEAAGEAVGPDDDHGLAAVQVPFNVAMADAFTRRNHRAPSEGDADGPVSALSFAHEAGLSVVTSASIGQGDLAVEGAVPPDVDATLAGETPAQRALNFARSAPGVTSSLVGTTDPDHVRENVAAGTFDPLGASAFDAVFE
ncbi:Predicted oxidoreductase [Halorubrum ezzemoulense]|uniref:Predicted oxidoreductase n=1 Tax=Halorubrum ezzemoulense TaxID=337243 RepID=A0A238UNR4_HALEZ|nr:MULTISPECIES: aldo/keto reductase [Halorubrum]TKX38599.1 aldo/keto reductase [Halorubrum sp. CGM4_25_10-8A]SNR23247.1 Predicted oxidoreductase [Halorubrum ezzemoulense]